MSLKVRDSDPPIVQPSTCFKNLLLNLKVHSVSSFISNLLKTSFEQIGVLITWKTRNIQSLFPLKNKSNYKSCVTYNGDCSCGSRYNDETKRNAEVRWNEHNNATKIIIIINIQLRSIIYCSLET